MESPIWFLFSLFHIFMTAEACHADQTDKKVNIEGKANVKYYYKEIYQPHAKIPHSYISRGHQSDGNTGYNVSKSFQWIKCFNSWNSLWVIKKRLIKESRSKALSQPRLSSAPKSKEGCEEWFLLGQPFCLMGRWSWTPLWTTFHPEWTSFTPPPNMWATMSGKCNQSAKLRRAIGRKTPQKIVAMLQGPRARYHRDHDTSWDQLVRLDWNLCQ